MKFKHYKTIAVAISAILLLLSFNGCRESLHDLTKAENYNFDSISIYFTNPFSDPDLDDALISLINNHPTNEYLDLCFYGLNRENVIQAIENAVNRGVHVRFVGNKDGSADVAAKTGDYYDGYNRIAEALDSKFPVSGKQRTSFPTDSGFDDFILINNSTIMHNKFALASDSYGHKYVYTGSTNSTDSGFERNNNNTIVFKNKNIHATYLQQFEYLLEISGASAVDSVVTHNIKGVKVDVLFAPQYLDGKRVMDHVMEQVDAAESTINFMIFSFPHRYLNDQLAQKHKDGITIQGIFDESQLSNSSEEYLAQRGIPCKIDGNLHVNGSEGGKLHHKTMILDADQDDAVVITGSFNWSDSANEENNENLVFIHSKEIAQKYMQEWNARWDEGTSVATVPTGDTAGFQEIIINEVMWMGNLNDSGTSSYQDEFIELKNMTGSTIDLSGWAIKGAAMSGKPLVLSGCTILANSTLVIQTKDMVSSAYASAPNIVISDLSIPNDRVELILESPDGTIIDYAGDGSDGDGFAGTNISGSTGLKKSMARNAVYGDGKTAANWFTTNTQVNIQGGYTLYTYATPGSDNTSGALPVSVLDIVISEIGWAGTSSSIYDEWIELHNNTGSDIVLGPWSIEGDMSIDLTGTIPANSYFLLERTDDNSVSTKTADQIYSGSLNNDGADLTLQYNGTDIDTISMSGGWGAGSSGTILSMERTVLTNPADAGNWQDGSGETSGAQNSSD
ncbi:MAG: hypothetical protein GY754_00845 [bacterium]|nr:hypothetical protein [bacterium]